METMSAKMRMSRWRRGNRSSNKPPAAGLHVAGRVREVVGAGGGVVDGGVNYALIDPVPQNSGGTIHQRLDEQGRVEFVDVVVVDNGFVEAVECGGNFLGEVLALVIKEIRE